MALNHYSVCILSEKIYIYIYQENSLWLGYDYAIKFSVESRVDDEMSLSQFNYL